MSLPLTKVIPLSYVTKGLKQKQNEGDSPELCYQRLKTKTDFRGCIAGNERAFLEETHEPT